MANDDANSGSGGGLTPEQVRNIASSEIAETIKNLFPSALLNLDLQNPNSPLERLLSNPVTYIIGLVVAWVYGTFIQPIFEALATAGTALVEGVVVLFLGGDGELSAQGALGLADVPLYAADYITGSAAPIGVDLVSVIKRLNADIAALGGIAGPFSPALVIGLRIAIIYAVAWLLWRLVLIIDIPLIQVGPLLRTLTAPFRKLLEVVR